MFDKVIEAERLRYRWTGSDAIDASWRFVHYQTRHGTLYVRVDAGKPWTYFKENGAAAADAEASTILGRAGTAQRIIQEHIDAVARVRKAPARGNPYGRYPEGLEMGILGRYEDMEEIDFTILADGLGMRVIDEGFLDVYGANSPLVRDEWDREWSLLSAPTAYRPWALYYRGAIAHAAPDAATVKAVSNICKLPACTWRSVVNRLTRTEFDVIQTLDRKSAVSQNRVMNNNSANDVARLLLLPDDAYEWLHLIAFSLGGADGEPQTPDNLILGTAAANTAMMSMEEFIKGLLRSGLFTVASISVSRTCVDRDFGWMATDIDYTAALFKPGAKPFIVRETFNPLSRLAPDYFVVQMTRQLKLDRLKSGHLPVPVSDTMRKPGARRGRRL